MLRANQLDVDRASVLVIDVQEKLLPVIRGRERLLATLRKLLSVTQVLDVPVLATEQYPEGIGPTDNSIRPFLQAAKAPVISKATFSAWAAPAVRDALLSLDRPQIILVGIESHVCVQQTALDLVSRDYDVYVCADAVGSRGRLDHECALARMRQEGVWVTSVEAVVFELCGRCDSDRFKAMLRIIKEMPPPADE